MKILRKLVDRCLEAWLAPIVELDDPNTQPPIANPQRKRLHFMILTPQVEQLLDASA